MKAHPSIPSFRSIARPASIALSLMGTGAVWAADIRLDHVRNPDGTLTLSWSGGLPTYQLQSRSGLEQAWANVGQPTLESSAQITIGDGNAFYRVVADYTARYEVVLNATWSRETHPQDWPNPGHWSGLVGGVHNDQVSFFQEGATASEGIRLMAERGQQGTLLAEVGPAIQAGTAHFRLQGGGIPVSPGSVSLTFPQPMSRDFPLVTLCSMVAPSPDWFVGVNGLSLIKDGEWERELTVPLYPYDAGTDSGATFASADVVTVPRGVITRLTAPPIAVNGIVVPFATFKFRRLD